MASYVVMAPDGRVNADEVFVRDGFAFVAFLIPMVWLLWHRLWIEALLALAAALCLAVLRDVSGFGIAALLLSLLVSLYAGLEGAALRLAALRRRGWREVGVVEADDEEAAETRWLVETGTLPEAEAGPPEQPSALGARHRPDTGPVVGLLLNPGKT